MFKGELDITFSKRSWTSHVQRGPGHHSSEEDLDITAPKRTWTSQFQGGLGHPSSRNDPDITVPGRTRKSQFRELYLFRSRKNWTSQRSRKNWTSYRSRKHWTHIVQDGTGRPIGQQGTGHHICNKELEFTVPRETRTSQFQEGPKKDPAMHHHSENQD